MWALVRAPIKGSRWFSSRRPSEALSANLEVVCASVCTNSRIQPGPALIELKYYVLPSKIAQGCWAGVLCALCRCCAGVVRAIFWILILKVEDNNRSKCLVDKRPDLLSLWYWAAAIWPSDLERYGSLDRPGGFAFQVLFGEATAWVCYMNMSIILFVNVPWWFKCCLKVVEIQDA